VGLNEAPVAQECVEGYIFRHPPTRLLILRRPPDRQRIWVPVSGKVESTDHDLAHALRRELAEETGFTDPLDVFPLDWVVRFDGPDGRPWRLHAFGVRLADDASPRLSGEHEAYEWVEPAEALQRLHYEDNRDAVRRLLERIGTGTAASAPKA
jgi:8-oxo-dGTP pyrophosphatase MutT (NUDIX family)